MQQIIAYIAGIMFNIILGWENALVVRQRIAAHNPKQIEHGLYLTGYCVLVFVYWAVWRDWSDAVAIFLLHGCVFPVAYNRFRNEPAFELSETTTAKTDKFLYDLGFRTSAYFDFSVLAVSLFFLILSIFKYGFDNIHTGAS